MIVCTGRATKRIDELQAGVKEYVATLALGATTPSFDLETEIDATYPTAHIDRALVDSVIPSFTGRIEQVPPAFSACKVDGRRAYKMARQGQEVELKPKTLVIDKIEVLEFSPSELTLRIICSKGTYIRALARDIGIALRSGATPDSPAPHTRRRHRHHRMPLCRTGHRTDTDHRCGHAAGTGTRLRTNKNEITEMKLSQFKFRLPEELIAQYPRHSATKRA